MSSKFAWKQIVTEASPDLYRFFLGSFPPQLASELVQETLIRLVKKCNEGQFDPTKASIKTYSFGIARFVRLEHLKKQPDFYLVDDDSDLDVQIIDQASITDDVSHLRWAISQLKPIEQELILSMIDEDSSFTKLAEDFNMPMGTVKSHIHRAKEKLRELMEIKL